jgi:hypothetical protein
MSNIRRKLTPEDFALLNPNTRTCPVFRTSRDAELTKAIYGRVPVLVNESRGDEGNPWGESFLRMFYMANDSHLFRTRNVLEAEGYVLEGNVFACGDERMLPLFEAKMVHQFDHRWGTYEGQTEAQANQGKLPEVAEAEHSDEEFFSLPRYWVPRPEVEKAVASRSVNDWIVGWRDICRNTDERTTISSVIPRAGAGDTLLLAFSEEEPSLVAVLAANLNAFVLDYVSRQKQGGTHLKYHVFKQLALLSPALLTEAPWTRSELGAWMNARTIELTVTSRDLEPFARDLGHDGPPFRWDSERRIVLRAELDAAFFHLYGFAEEDVDYVMETFPIVKRRDEEKFGHYRTKALILDVYRKMADAIASGLPYETILDPPPADPRVAHRSERWAEHVRSD